MLYGHAISYSQGVAAEAGVRLFQRHRGLSDDGNLLGRLPLLVFNLRLLSQTNSL